MRRSQQRSNSPHYPEVYEDPLHYEEKDGTPTETREEEPPMRQTFKTIQKSIKDYYTETNPKKRGRPPKVRQGDISMRSNGMVRQGQVPVMSQRGREERQSSPSYGRSARKPSVPQKRPVTSSVRVKRE